MRGHGSPRPGTATASPPDARIMLAALSIRDIVLIDKLDLEFRPGLCVLTGETGAGKSILLDAFTLAIGGRGDTSLVRRGADQGQVTASFDLDARSSRARAPRRQRLRGRATLILRRIQGPTAGAAPSSTTSPSSVQLLRQVGQALVEIHGQHDDRALIDPSGHRDLVDAFGGLSGEAAARGRAWEAWRGRRGRAGAACERDRRLARQCRLCQPRARGARACSTRRLARRRRSPPAAS